jgi:putative endonuclease
VSAWFVYVLHCADGTLYTGITTDLDRRLREHNGEGHGGARYTRGRRPVRLHYYEAAASRAEAARREAVVKKLDRRSKLALGRRRRSKKTAGNANGLSVR